MTRILIVEDSATQAERLRGVLEEGGYDAVVAYDAESALPKIDSSFDMVISDIMMPGMSGYELCKRIKAGVYGRSLPVMLLSTLGDPMDIIGGLECGADNFVTKPYEANQLLERGHRASHKAAGCVPAANCAWAWRSCSSAAALRSIPTRNRSSIC